MAQNGLLDTIAQAYMRNVGDPASQLFGNGLRGLLGLDPAPYADTFGMETYRNAQALSNAPTPLALAAVPAALVKGVKAAKAVDQVAPRAEALRRAAEQKYRTEWHMGFSGPTFDVIDPALRGSVTGTPASKIATFLTDSVEDAKDFALNASKVTGKKPNTMNIGVSGRIGNIPWKDSYPPIRSEGGQRFLTGILLDYKDAGFDAVRITGGNDSISGKSAANILAVLNDGSMRDMKRANFIESLQGRSGLTLGIGGLGAAGLLDQQRSPE